MEKIVVTTDQSVNSKSAIRFAIDLAKMRKAKLVVLNVYSSMKPFTWSDEDFIIHEQGLIEKIKAEIFDFVRKIARSMGCLEVDIEIAVTNNSNVTEGIIKFTELEPYSYIFIATHGAGLVSKLLGTNAADLILRSKVPVVSVPSRYRYKKPKRVLYATDMVNYDKEVVQVLDFVRPIGAELTTVHIEAMKVKVGNGTTAKAIIKQNVDSKVKIYPREWDMPDAITKGIEEEIRRCRPSVIVFFTHQIFGFLNKLLHQANAVEQSFYGKIPVISFRK